MAIRIVVDSSADYSSKEIEKRGIYCAPMTITFGDESFLDGVELEKSEFYNKLVNEGEFPKTSQPSPAVVVDIFEEAKEAGDDVIVITLASVLSGTYQSVVMAKDMAEYDRIHIIDSKSATLGIRLLVDRACHLRDQGKSVEEIVSEIEALVSRVRIFAGIDTLEYLYKGGRLSKTAAGIGTLAKVKPVITLGEEGQVEIASKQIGFRHACNAISKMVKAAPIDYDYPVYFVYAYDKGNCISFAKSLEKKGIEIPEIKTREIGPTIGTHIGPNAYGIIYIEKEQ